MYLQTNAQTDAWVREDESDSWSPKARRIVRWTKRRSSDAWKRLTRLYALIYAASCGVFVGAILLFSIILDKEVSQTYGFWSLIGALVIIALLLATRPFLMPNGERIVRRLKAELRPGQIIDESDVRLQQSALGFYTRWPDPVAGKYIDRYLYETAPLAAGFGSRKAIEHCATHTREAIDAYRETGEVDVMKLQTVLQPIVERALQPHWPAPTPGSLV